ncbi:MAG: hypothetical protein V1922_00095 [bacterium]
MSYIPHGKYPKTQKGFNVISMMPGLFKNIDFKDFVLTLGSDRANDCFSGIQFLYSSKYQENDGSKLIMMLSAIERSCGKWKSLDVLLRSKDFRRKIIMTKDGNEACTLLNDKIEEYLNNYGSNRLIVKFFRENLTNRSKMIFTGGIRRKFTYSKQRIANGTLLKPVYIQKSETIDEELGRVLKSFIYYIRNGFVHKASYIIIPNKKDIKIRKSYEFDVYIDGLPKEHWISVIPFEVLNSLFCKAFVRYWRNEYLEKS